MKKASVSIACAALAACAAMMACDYTVPLVDTPEMEIDKQIVGLWARANVPDHTERLLILPLSKCEYMIAYPANEKNSMFAKACLASCAGKTLVQVQWFGTAEGTLPDNNRAFQFATYSAQGDELSIRMLNTAVVSKELGSSAALSQAIENNKDSKDLFNEPMIFRRIKP